MQHRALTRQTRVQTDSLDTTLARAPPGLGPRRKENGEFHYKKNEIMTFAGKMDRTRDSYVKQNMLDSERQALHVAFTYIT